MDRNAKIPQEALMLAETSSVFSEAAQNKGLCFSSFSPAITKYLTQTTYGRRAYLSSSFEDTICHSREGMVAGASDSWPHC